MAKPDDSLGHGGLPDPARRPRQTIDIEAVEAPPAGGSTEGLKAESSASAMPRSAASRPGRTRMWQARAATAVAAVAAIVVAALLWMLAAPREARNPDEIAARLAQLEAGQRDEAASRAALSSDASSLADIAARLARLEAAPASSNAAPAEGASVDRSAAAPTAIREMTERLDALDRRTRDNAAAAERASERVNAVAGLAEGLRKSGDQQNVLEQSERSVLEGYSGRLQSIESRLDRVQTQAEQAAAAEAMRDALPLGAATVAAALRDDVERGIPFAAEQGAAQRLGLDGAALAILEPFAATGVPSRERLLRELSSMLPEMARVSKASGEDGSYLGRIRAGVERLVHIRPAGDLRGDDPASVIGRIEMDVTAGDVAAVVSELDKLPAPARSLAQAWRTKALARESAIAAARQLATAAFAVLGEASAAAVRRR